MRTGVSQSGGKYAHRSEQGTSDLLHFLGTTLPLGQQWQLRDGILWLDMTPAALIHFVSLYIISSYLTVHIYPRRAGIHFDNAKQHTKTLYIHFCLLVHYHPASKGRRHARIGNVRLIDLLSIIYHIPGPKTERRTILKQSEPPEHRFA